MYFTPFPQILPLPKYCLFSALLILGHDVCHHIPKIYLGVVWGCAVQRKENSLPEINPLGDVCRWEVLMWTSRLWCGEGTLPNKPGVSCCHWCPEAHYWDEWPEKLLGMVLNLFHLYFCRFLVRFSAQLWAVLGKAGVSQVVQKVFSC